MHLKDFTSAIFEEEAPKSKPVAAPAPQVAPTSVPYQAAVAVPDQVNESADHSDDAYQRLLAKTDFTQTSVFQAINKHLAPMATLALDDKTKFSIALKQAQALDGVDPSAISVVFDQVKSTLQAESDKFSQTVQAKTATDVDAKNQKAQELSAQVKQLTEEAFAAQQKLQDAQHRFDVALKTRLDEISQEQTKYASLLA